MLTNRLIQIFLGSISVLLVALLAQSAFRSPSEAQAAYAVPGTTKVIDVRLISALDLPDVKAIVPLGSYENGTTFAVQTKQGILVYHSDYFPNPNLPPARP